MVSQGNSFWKGIHFLQSCLPCKCISPLWIFLQIPINLNNKCQKERPSRAINTHKTENSRKFKCSGLTSFSQLDLITEWSWYKFSKRPKETFYDRHRSLTTYMVKKKNRFCKQWFLTLFLLNPDTSCFWKQFRSRSVGFWRNQLIWICTVCHWVWEFISTIWIKYSDWLKSTSGHGILIYSAKQGLRAINTPIMLKKKRSVKLFGPD